MEKVTTYWFVSGMAGSRPFRLTLEVYGPFLDIAKVEADVTSEAGEKAIVLNFIQLTAEQYDKTKLR